MTGACPCKSCCHDASCPHSKYPLECHRAQYIDRFYSPFTSNQYSSTLTSFLWRYSIILFHPSNNQVSSWITACLASINAWMKGRHLKQNLSKTSVHPSEETTLPRPHHSQLFSPTQKAKKTSSHTWQLPAICAHMNQIHPAEHPLSQTFSQTDTILRAVSHAECHTFNT